MQHFFKLLLVVIVTTGSYYAQAQVQAPTYAELTVEPKANTNAVAVIWDDGTAKKWAGEQHYKEDGKVKVFESAMEALNFFTAQGYEVVSVHTQSFDKIMSGGWVATHYILKRTK